MGDWKLPEAQRCLDEIIRRAEACGPQRVASPDRDAVVLGAQDFEPLLAQAGLGEADCCHAGDARDGEPVPLLEFMQRSPLAEAVRAGEWPWEWDDTTRNWVLPGNALPS